MRALLLTGCLLSPLGQAVEQGCVVDLAAAFQRLKTEAIASVPVEQAFDLLAVGLEVRVLPGNLAGQAVASNSMIYIDPGMCEHTPVYRAGVLAHEWGHWLSWVRRPAVLATYRRHEGRIPEELLEDWANREAAGIFAKAGFDTQAWLKETDYSCKTDREYFCKRAASWRAGLAQVNQKES